MSPTIAKSLPESAAGFASGDGPDPALGCLVSSLETPALLVDLDALEGNIRAMRAVLDGTGVALRPHFKNHRSIALARQQMAAGAIGLCVARLRHAEVLADAQIPSLLLTNEVASLREFDRAAALSRRVELIVAVDSEYGVDGLAKAAVKAGAQVHVVIDVNLGMDRTGVDPAEVPNLASAITRRAGLRLRGLTAYEGHLQRLLPGEEKHQRCAEAVATLATVAADLRASGHAIDIVSAGGTGTCAYVARETGLTEIQAGCYLLMEELYRSSAPQFQTTLSLLATVVSRHASRAVVDAGLKVLSSERGLGTLSRDPRVRVDALHAEHGLLTSDAAASKNSSLATLDLRSSFCDAPLPPIGAAVELTVPYADGTVNLNSRMYGIRHNRVQAVFVVQR